jgi:hypothetical protein
MPVRAPQRPASVVPLSTLARALAGPDPSRNLAAEADRYATQYPHRARIIRLRGEVPPECDFPEPDDGLMYAIITGDSPVLRAFDPPYTEAA